MTVEWVTTGVGMAAAILTGGLAVALFPEAGVGTAGWAAAVAGILAGCLHAVVAERRAKRRETLAMKHLHHGSGS